MTGLRNILEAVECNQGSRLADRRRIKPQDRARDQSPKVPSLPMNICWRSVLFLRPDLVGVLAISSRWFKQDFVLCSCDRRGTT